MRTTGRLLLAAGAGTLAPIAWAPLAIWPAAIAAYAILFAILRQCASAAGAATVGASFGLAMHLNGHGWVFEAMRMNAGVPLVPSLIAVTAFVVYLTAFTALPCAAWFALNNRTRGHAISAFAWAGWMTLGEWSRSIPFNGLTSLSVGYALIDTPWKNLASLAGTYGLGLLGYLLASALCVAFERRSRAVIAPTAFAAASLLAGMAAGRTSWVAESGMPLTFRLIQGNVTQDQKFDPAHARTQIRNYVESITEQRADLVATPETAFPLFLTELPSEALRTVEAFSSTTQTHVLLGIATLDATGEGHNSMIHISPREGVADRHDKVRLMPFGEYAPAGFSWFTRGLQTSLKDMRPGSGNQPPFTVKGQNVGSLICSEDLTAVQGRRWLLDHPSTTLFINPGNLAWFANSDALPQLLQIARMRALELGRPILRVANTGISAAIDHRGSVTAFLAEGRIGALSGTVQGMKGITPYVRLGDWPVLIASVMGIALSLVRELKAARTVNVRAHPAAQRRVRQRARDNAQLR